MSGRATLWNLMPEKYVSQVLLMCRLYVQRLIGRGIEKVLFQVFNPRRCTPHFTSKLDAVTSGVFTMITTL